MAQRHLPSAPSGHTLLFTAVFDFRAVPLRYSLLFQLWIDEPCCCAAARASWA